MYYNNFDHLKVLYLKVSCQRPEKSLKLPYKMAAPGCMIIALGNIKV